MNLKQKLNIAAFIFYLAAFAWGWIMRSSFLEVLFLSVIFDFGRMIYLWSRNSHEENSEEIQPSFLFKKKTKIIFGILLGLAILLEIFSFEFEGFILIIFLFNRFFETFFPAIRLGWKNPPYRSEKDIIRRISVVIFIIAIVSEYLIWAFNGTAKIWTLWMIPVIVLFLLVQLEQKFQQQLFPPKLIALLIIILFSLQYANVDKRLWPSSFNKSLYGLSERPVNTKVEASWDWGATSHRFHASREEVDIIVASYKCGRNFTNRMSGYHYYSCMVKDTALVPGNHAWYEPYSTNRLRLHWYVPDTIQDLLPVNIYYDSVDQIVEVYEITEM